MGHIFKTRNLQLEKENLKYGPGLGAVKMRDTFQLLVELVTVKGVFSNS